MIGGHVTQVSSQQTHATGPVGRGGRCRCLGAGGGGPGGGVGVPAGPGQPGRGKRWLTSPRRSRKPRMQRAVTAHSGWPGETAAWRAWRVRCGPRASPTCAPSNAPTAGWRPPALGEDVYVRSSVRDQVVRAGSAEIPRPGCITPEAVDAMLADLGAGPEVPAPADSAFARPDGASAYRPSYHITPRENWMNDPQRPFWLDGQWHYYYLYNSGYPERERHRVVPPHQHRPGALEGRGGGH